MKYFLSILVIPFFAFSLLAQPAEESDDLDFLDDSEDALGSASNEAQKKANAYLAKKQEAWENDNQTDKWGGVGFAPIGGDPTDPNFTQYRIAAYNSAMLELKRNIAVNLAAEIQTDMSLIYGKPAAAAQQKTLLQDIKSKTPMEMGMLNKAKLLIHNELDNQLDKRGIKPGTPAAQEVVADLETRISNSVQVLAQAEMGAIYTMKTIEDG